MALHTEPRDVFEAAARQRTIKVRCDGCDHAFIFDPHELWWLFERKGWDQRLRYISWRFRCRACGRRCATVSLSHDAPGKSRLPLPDALEWKRAIRRYRG